MISDTSPSCPLPSSDPRQKALHINLDAHRYGAFAEIGAGQEVVSWFFHVGGASGTIAKSMSAYDMTVSDNIYGKSGRYVSRERLIAMLDHEYSLLIERLASARGSTTSFFCFADTFSARNYAGTNECHGWMGIRFQQSPGSEPSQIIVHVSMNDLENVHQQEAVGILGVNLIYGAFYYSHDIEHFLSTLQDGLRHGRIEVDYLEARGPGFEKLDHRLVAISLLRHELAPAVLFDSAETPTPATEFFHKRPILLERGSFRALHHVFPNLVQSCRRELAQLCGEEAEKSVHVLEFSLNNVLKTRQSTDDEVLEIVTQLCGQNHNVIVSNYSEFFHLTQFLRRFSSSPIGFIVSVALLPLLLEDERYALLKGGILEASARLFQQKAHLLVYPVDSSLFSSYLEMIKFDLARIEFPQDGLVRAKNLALQNVTQHLYRYLVDSNIIIDVDEIE
jgi:hypothetical protein